MCICKPSKDRLREWGSRTVEHIENSCSSFVSYFTVLLRVIPKVGGDMQRLESNLSVLLFSNVFW